MVIIALILTGSNNQHANDAQSNLGSKELENILHGFRRLLSIGTVGLL